MYYRPATRTAFVVFSNVWDLSQGAASLEAQQRMMMATANKLLAQLGL